MRQLLPLVYFIWMPVLVSGQSFSFPTFNQPVKSVTDLLLPHWTLKDSTAGDLNGDQRPDLALILEYADTVTEQRPDGHENTGKPRILLILVQVTDSPGYRVALQNNTFILREGEGGMVSDPYDDIAIRKGVLNIDYQYVRGTASYKFRWKAPDFYLIGASSGGESGGAFEFWDFNFLTKKAEHTWKKDPEKKDHVEWKQIQWPSPVKLRDMKAPYELQIFHDVFI